MTAPAGQPRCRNGACMRMAPGLCRPCADRLERWLDELPSYVATVADYQPLPAAGAGPRVSGSRERPLPGGVDRLSWLGPANPGDRLDFAGDPVAPGLQVGDVPLTAVLTSWAGLVAELLEVHQPPRTVTDLVGFLRRWQPQIVREPWSDEYAREVHDLWATARRLAGESERWVRIGACIAVLDDGTVCGETLSARPEARVIRCPGCGADWARELWLLLGSAMEETGT